MGGAVRDLLLGGHPKDFDIATDATPEQVNALFRNSRIIGRRFRIVHVRFGREIIEVTTFRGHHDAEASNRHNSRSHQSSSGMLLRDNVYGTLEEDAVRRDLTVNALYYDSKTFEVFDHVHGLDDLARRSICIIGEPVQRFREDPVRMLRVLRFAAKLDFSIERHTAAAIPECVHLLADIPAARLFDEFLKLFLAGYAEATLKLLLDHKLLTYLFPESAHLISTDPAAAALTQAAMRNTDRRIASNMPVTPAFQLAALLWPAVERLYDRLRAKNTSPIEAMHSAAQQVVFASARSLAIPKRFSQPMREIWELQLRLEKRARKASDLLTHRRFRAAYDFLLLREEAGAQTDGLGQWWTDFQEQPEQQQQIQSAANEQTIQRRRRRPRKRRASDEP